MSKILGKKKIVKNLKEEGFVDKSSQIPCEGFSGIIMKYDGPTLTPRNFGILGFFTLFRGTEKRMVVWGKGKKKLPSRLRNMKEQILSGYALVLQEVEKRENDAFASHL